MGLKSSNWSFFENLFLGLHILFYKKKMVRPSTEAQQSDEQAPQNVQMTLKVQSFVSKFKFSFVDLPEDISPSNPGTAQKCLRTKKKMSQNFQLFSKFRGVQSKRG
jgi:hypothetical protein